MHRKARNNRRRVLMAGAAVTAVAGITMTARRARRPTVPLTDHDRAHHTDDLDGVESVIVSHDGGELAVTSAGPADGPVVVLAHCWTGSRNTWAPVARRLVDAGCRVVRWDQRGHGRSVAGHKGHSIEGLADDLATVLEQLDLHDVVLVGHSMGGMTVQALATHHHALFHERARGVVLVATAGGGLNSPLTRPTADAVRNARIEKMFERPEVGRLLVRTTFGRHAHPDHLEATRTDFVATPAQVRGDFAESMQVMDLREGNATIDVPCTILVGSRDALTPVPLSRQLARTIPGARLEVLPNHGHMLPYEAPDVVAAAVLALIT